MRIRNKKKFITRIIEVIVIITTIILTIIAINYANKTRGYKAYGGEYCIPLIGLIIITVIESIYQESEKRRKEDKK